MRVASLFIAAIALSIAAYSCFQLKKQNKVLNEYSVALVEYTQKLRGEVKSARSESRNAFELLHKAQKPEIVKAETQQQLERAATVPVSEKDIQERADEVKKLKPEDVARDPATRARAESMADEARKESERLKQKQRSCVEKIVALRKDLAALEQKNVPDQVQAARKTLQETENDCEKVAKRIADVDTFKVLLAALLRAAAVAALAEGNFAVAYGLWAAANALDGGGSGGEPHENGPSGYSETKSPHSDGAPIITEKGELGKTPEGVIIPGIGGDIVLRLNGEELMVRQGTLPEVSLGRVTKEDAIKLRGGACYAQSISIEKKKATFACINGHALDLTLR